MQKNNKFYQSKCSPKNNRFMTLNNQNYTSSSQKFPQCFPEVRDYQKRRSPPNGKNLPRKREFIREKEQECNMTVRQKPKSQDGGKNLKKTCSNQQLWKKNSMEEILSQTKKKIGSLEDNNKS